MLSCRKASDRPMLARRGAEAQRRLDALRA